MSEDALVAANSTTPRPPPKAELAVVVAILLVGSASLALFYFRGLSNLYGDGIAHMEGARRLFDSLTPGYSEIGSVWLPLYHLIVAPLAISDFLWRTGLGGGLVSTAAFILAAWVVFRLGYEMNRSLAAAIVALAGFLLCPNMLSREHTADRATGDSLDRPGNLRPRSLSAGRPDARAGAGSAFRLSGNIDSV